ncbi:shikimate kinase [Thalassoroseus pseudoceratinae]|uniref:shikimate kinase n=1 Tax=Thalassoroseus pseudoceratinae TaxID=2713176 RepID=UPI0014246702|nr:shikimate kinase [Thalassoroseus pseudoceratinae]
MILSLIGYRGSGKSTVAAILAQRLGWAWVDSDREIVRRAGRPIREIFAQNGEPAFRELERQVLAELLSRDELVLATGGGAILNADTRAQMKTVGPIVWLTADIETLMTRLAGDANTKDDRPNLTDVGGRQEIETVLNQRNPIYQECADITLPTDQTDPETLAGQIISAMPRWDAKGEGS